MGPPPYRNPRSLFTQLYSGARLGVMIKAIDLMFRLNLLCGAPLDVD
jgi:hypothetical protein